MAIWEPFEFRGRRVTSFKGLDRALGAPKGTAFRTFKRSLAVLAEDEDFLRLDAAADGADIEALKAAGRVYQASVHVVLLTESGVRKAFS